jgi:hypothetical protein
MASACDLSLVLHGAILLLLSQVAGYAFFRAINRRDPETIGMWRMSHAACSAAAVLLIALGPVAPHLRLRHELAVLLDGALIGSSYAFCVGTVIAASSGHRGTKPRGPAANVAVYVLYVVGAVASTLSALVFAWGAASAYFAASSP